MGVSAISGLMTTSFYLKHNWDREKDALDFRLDFDQNPGGNR